MFQAMMLIICLGSIDLAKQNDYEAAIPLMNYCQSFVPPDLHYKFYFYKTTAEFQTLKKKEAIESSFKFFKPSISLPDAMSY